MKYSLVKNQKEFAIVEDYLLKGVNLEESTVTPLEDDDIWDDIIDHYNNKGLRYTVVDDQEEVTDEFLVKQPSMLSRIGERQSGFGGFVPVIEDYCWTITTKQMRCPNSGVVPIGQGQYRYLTPKETWLLQGYSEADFEAAATVNKKTALYHQAGNSIPVPIFESLFKKILKDLDFDWELEDTSA